MKLKDACSVGGRGWRAGDEGGKHITNLDSVLKSRQHFADKGPGKCHTMWSEPVSPFPRAGNSDPEAGKFMPQESL